MPNRRTPRKEYSRLVSVMKGMLKLRTDGVPTYLMMLPDGTSILFTAQ